MSIKDIGLSIVRGAGFYRKTHKLYYHKSDLNFGDILSRYIVERLIGKEVHATDKRDAYKIVAIGSLISDKTVRTGGVFWGTGVQGMSVSKNTKPEHPVSFRAVRGPVTRNHLVSAGFDCPPIYGDPALLLPRFYSPKVSKKYKLGYVPHLIHTNHLMCTEDVRKISLGLNHNSNEEIHRIIDEINECETIISSSLHGVIVANAYGIPAKYMRVHGIPLAGIESLKFSDYFQSVSMPDQEPVILTPGQTVTEEFSDLISKTVDLKIDLDLLLDSFPSDLVFA